VPSQVQENPQVYTQQRWYIAANAMQEIFMREAFNILHSLHLPCTQIQATKVFIEGAEERNILHAQVRDTGAAQTTDAKFQTAGPKGSPSNLFSLICCTATLHDVVSLSSDTFLPDLSRQLGQPWNGLNPSICKCGWFCAHDHCVQDLGCERCRPYFFSRLRSYVLGRSISTILSRLRSILGKPLQQKTKDLGMPGQYGGACWQLAMATCHFASPVIS
jgi:hypothetical protein